MGVRATFENETLQEHHRQGVTKEVVESAQRRRDMLAAQLEQLETQSRDHQAKVADIQEERTKLLLANAQRQANKVLATDAPALDPGVGAGILALMNVTAGSAIQ